MSTPEVNNVMQLRTDSYSVDTAGGGQPVTTTTKSLTRYSAESRPRSISTTKSASGWRNPTGWHHSKMVTTPCPAIDFITYLNVGGTRAYYDGCGWGEFVQSVPMFPENLENRSVLKALSQLKNQSVNFGVAFAERKETAELATQSATRIAKSVSKFKNKFPKDWARILRRGALPQGKVSQGWLELQYGWKPLLSDVHGACKALDNKERDGDAYRATVKGSCKQVDRGIYYRHPENVTGLCGIGVKYTATHTSLVRLDYVLENPLLATMSSLGLTNPAEILWERVPYSFVVDWFLPVGKYLSAFDASLGWSFKGGSSTQMSKYTEQGNSSYGGTERYGSVWAILGSPSAFHSEGFRMIRSVYNSSPLPRFPGIKNPLSTGHLANAIALLGSRFR